MNEARESLIMSTKTLRVYFQTILFAFHSLPFIAILLIKISRILQHHNNKHQVHRKMYANCLIFNSPIKLQLPINVIATLELTEVTSWLRIYKYRSFYFIMTLSLSLNCHDYLKILILSTINIKQVKVCTYLIIRDLHQKCSSCKEL